MKTALSDPESDRWEIHGQTTYLGQGYPSFRAPYTGANSFTEGQVKDRFAKMGFAEVKDLKKDDQGIWRGMASHAGKDVSIGMDYKGNVAAQ